MEKKKILYFDIVRFSNEPEYWEAMKHDISKQIERYDKLIQYLGNQIKTDFCDFNPTYFLLHNLFGNHLIEEVNRKLRTYSYRIDLTLRNKNFHKLFFYEYYYEESKEINGKMCYNVWEVETGYKHKYKNDFIDLFSYLSFYIGDLQCLVSTTDLQILRYKRLIKDDNFLDILEAPAYKQYAEEMENIINNYKKNSIKPKGNLTHELSEFWITVALIKRGIPSLRDLEKNSVFKKDKWRRYLNGDAKFIIHIAGEIENSKDKLGEELYVTLRDYCMKKTLNRQEIEKKNNNKSYGVQEYIEDKKYKGGTYSGINIFDGDDAFK